LFQIKPLYKTAQPPEQSVMPYRSLTCAAAWMHLWVLAAGLAAASAAAIETGRRFTIQVWETEDGLPQNADQG
jgi:hypothetical protein